MSKIKCYFLEETETYRHYLRRFVFTKEGQPKCAGTHGYHNVRVFLKDGEQVLNRDSHPHEDPLWPKKCACGYEFQEDDQWQVFTERLYKRQDNGQITTTEDAPPGAMWYRDYCNRRGPDNHILYVKTPGGLWNVDSRANNCTLPEDNEHRCWVREGTPPNVHVSKNGNTCGAGAGSILCGSYHGFLRHGYLEGC